MKKAIGVIVLCLSLSALGLADGFSLKATGGLSLLMGGNYNDAVAGLNAQLAAEATTVSSTLEKLSLGMTLEGELIYQFTENVGIGVGSGFISASNDSTRGGNVGIFDFTQTLRPTVTAIPVTLNLHFFLPLGPRANLHLFAGPGVYFSTIKLDDQYSVPLLTWNSTGAFRPESKTAFGVQGGLGLELGITPRLYLVVDAQGRWVNISDLVGTLTLTGTGPGGIPVNMAFNNLKFWYEEAEFVGTYYANYEITDVPPGGAGIRNVKDGAFSLSGVTFQAGFRIRL